MLEPTDPSDETTASELCVRHPGGSYPVLLGSGLLDELGLRLRRLRTSTGSAERLLVVSDSNVGALYGDRACLSLRQAGYDPILCTLPAGEPSKSLATVEQLIASAAAAKLERSSAVVALGGGVVGDVAGLVAALYLRGVALVQVPTSLLALVDSSIGGKVGVNSSAGKNLIGAFLSPQLVVGDLDCLRTLPTGELRSGLGEVAKSALLSGEAAWQRLRHFATRHGAQLASLTPSTLLPLVSESLLVKQRLVEADPFEQGPRALLNLGHTFGHGIESWSGYAFRHGEAVGLGLLAALRLGVALQRTAPRLLNELTLVLSELGLPMHIPNLELDGIWHFMQSDKKRRPGGLRFVLVAEPGQAALHDDIPPERARAALASLALPPSLHSLGGA